MDQDFMKQHRKNFGQREGKLSSNTKTQRNILMILVGSLKVGGRRHSCRHNLFCSPFLRMYFLSWNNDLLIHDSCHGKCWNVTKSVSCFVAGPGVREMLRLPEAGLLEIMPGDHPDYEVKSLTLLSLLTLSVQYIESNKRYGNKSIDIKVFLSLSI